MCCAYGEALPFVVDTLEHMRASILEREFRAEDEVLHGSRAEHLAGGSVFRIDECVRVVVEARGGPGGFIVAQAR